MAKDSEIDTWLTVHAVTSFVFAGFLLLAALVLGVLAFAVMAVADAPRLAVVMFGVFAAVCLVFGGLYLCTGVGVLRRKSWGRMLALIVSILSVPNIPFGTAYGALGIWLFGLEDRAIKRF